MNNRIAQQKTGIKDGLIIGHEGMKGGNFIDAQAEEKHEE